MVQAASVAVLQRPPGAELCLVPEEKISKAKQGVTHTSEDLGEGNSETIMSFL